MNRRLLPDEPPASTQRERRKQAIRESILQSAIDLFEAQGCDATTLEDICARAEISRPTFYSYYASKQELIQALGETLWLSLASELTRLSLASHTSTQDYIEAFFDMTRKQLSQYNRLEKDLIRLNMASDPRESNSMNILKGMNALFSAVYTQGRKRKDIGNRYPVDFLSEMTMGAISSVMMQWAVDADYPIDKRLKQLPDFIIGMLELVK